MRSKDHQELAWPAAHHRTSEADQGYLRLWFNLSRRPWNSVVLVPSIPGGSADEAARKLAEVGQKVSGLPVQAITMSALDYGTALALTDLQERIRRLMNDLSKSQVIIPPISEIEVRGKDQGQKPESTRGEAVWEQVPPGTPSGAAAPPPQVARFVISVPCLISEPLGLAATESADAVILMVEMGRTTMADVRRIVAQVGRDRVAGCVLV